MFNAKVVSISSKQATICGLSLKARPSFEIVAAHQNALI